MYRLLSTLAFAGVKLFRLLEVKGKEHIQKDGGFVVTCTHRGWIDVIMLAVAMYPIPVYYMAKKQLFAGKWQKRFFESIHAFPVNRDNPGPSTLKIPRKLLKEGKCVGIFPSGTRSSENLPLKRGAVTIAYKAKAPLVPAVYEGPAGITDILKGKRAMVTFGKPLLIKDIEGMERDDILQSYVELLEERMR